MAVPLVSLGVMPLALAGLLLTLSGLSLAGEGAWRVALWLLEALLALLRRLPDGWLTPSGLALVYSVLVLALALLWSIRQGWRDLWLFLLCGLFAVGWGPYGRRSGEGWRVDMMDVGHGQAIAISRNGQALLYDSGGRWPGGDAAQQVLLPYLRWQGLWLSGIIISHTDSDHAGATDAEPGLPPGLGRLASAGRSSVSARSAYLLAGATARLPLAAAGGDPPA
ncbi:MBL fold metallo-hydrolase [Edwardsiella ictaluri]|uniref:MBL fold metallo-hydrolase n=1 Tax=Edwardsiella ictaluri TaxID=67780 RepID=UPI0039F6D287